MSKRGNASARGKLDEGRGFLSQENCVLCEPAANVSCREWRSAVLEEKGGMDSEFSSRFVSQKSGVKG